MPTAFSEPSIESSHPKTLQRPRRGPPAPAVTSSRAELAVGEWLWACRVGSEADLIEEIMSHGTEASQLQPGLVRSPKRPVGPHRSTPMLAYGRQGFPVLGVQTLGDSQEAAIEAIASACARELKRSACVQVFAADTEEGRSLSTLGQALQEGLSHALQRRNKPLVEDGKAAQAEGGQLVQVCMLSKTTWAYGVILVAVAPSLYPGGVLRIRRPKGAPSRSAQKLLEALAWLGHGPEAHESCVDLGAAPGGWSLVLAARRCRVLAVDLGSLMPEVAQQVYHTRTNAFLFVPEESVDWLFCDMAYRPLEVAALLARWGRRRWARFLLCNIKLPMKKRVEMIRRVREILSTGGWTDLRVRQLYHDRDEVTIFGWRGFGQDTTPRDSRRHTMPAPAPVAEKAARAPARFSAKRPRTQAMTPRKGPKRGKR